MLFQKHFDSAHCSVWKPSWGQTAEVTFWCSADGLWGVSNSSCGEVSKQFSKWGTCQTLQSHKPMKIFGEKPIKNFGKKERGHIQWLPKFFQYPLLSQERVKLRTSNFVRTFLVWIRSEQKPVTNFVKSSRGRSEDAQNFSGHPYIGRITRSSLR